MNTISKHISVKYPLRLLVACFLVLLITSNLVACAGGQRQFGGDRPSVDKAMVHARLGKSYLQQKQYSVAKSELQAALRINSNHSESNYVMALLMLELGDYPVAEKYFAKAVRSDPENSSAAHDYGMLLCQTGSESKSVDFFEMAANNPLFDRADLSYMRAGECAAQVGDARAEAFLKRALSINPSLQAALFQLAQIKFAEKSFLSARAYVERFMAITKPQPTALMLAHKIELALNANDVAERYRAQLLEEFPGSEQAHLMRQKNKRGN